MPRKRSKHRKKNRATDSATSASSSTPSSSPSTSSSKYVTNKGASNGAVSGANGAEETTVRGGFPTNMPSFADVVSGTLTNSNANAPLGSSSQEIVRQQRRQQSRGQDVSPAQARKSRKGKKRSKQPQKQQQQQLDEQRQYQQQQHQHQHQQDTASQLQGQTQATKTAPSTTAPASTSTVQTVLPSPGHASAAQSFHGHVLNRAQHNAQYAQFVQHTQQQQNQHPLYQQYINQMLVEGYPLHAIAPPLRYPGFGPWPIGPVSPSGLNSLSNTNNVAIQAYRQAVLNSTPPQSFSPSNMETSSHASITEDKPGIEPSRQSEMDGTVRARGSSDSQQPVTLQEQNRMMDEGLDASHPSVAAHHTRRMAMSEGDVNANLSSMHYFEASGIRLRQTSSLFKGVSWHKRDKRWTARSWSGGKTKHIGSYYMEEVAAIAVDLQALEMGNKTGLNFSSFEERYVAVQNVIRLAATDSRYQQDWVVLQLNSGRDILEKYIDSKSKWAKTARLAPRPSLQDRPPVHGALAHQHGLPYPQQQQQQPQYRRMHEYHGQPQYQQQQHQPRQEQLGQRSSGLHQSPLQQRRQWPLSRHSPTHKHSLQPSMPYFHPSSRPYARAMSEPTVPSRSMNKADGRNPKGSQGFGPEFGGRKRRASNIGHSSLPKRLGTHSQGMASLSEQPVQFPEMKTEFRGPPLHLPAPSLVPVPAPAPAPVSESVPGPGPVSPGILRGNGASSAPATIGRNSDGSASSSLGIPANSGQHLGVASETTSSPGRLGAPRNSFSPEPALVHLMGSHNESLEASRCGSELEQSLNQDLGGITQSSHTSAAIPDNASTGGSGPLIRANEDSDDSLEALFAALNDSGGSSDE